MRVLLSRTMSDNGGLLTKGFTEEEMDKKSVNFFKDLLVLQTKYIDVIRESWVLRGMMKQQPLERILTKDGNIL